MHIAIVDDDLAFRTEFAGRQLAAISSTVETFTCDTFLATTSDTPFDLLLVDPFRQSSYDAATVLARAKGTAARVVVVSFHTSVDAIMTATEQQVDGYLVKSEPDHALVSHLAAMLASGQPAVSATLAPTLFSLLTRRRRPERTSRLTRRELAVLELVANGSSNRDIATQLGIAENTVKNHLRHILAKLKVRSRLAAVMVAVRDGVLDVAVTD